jgi:hypothetical protein
MINTSLLSHMEKLERLLWSKRRSNPVPFGLRVLRFTKLAILLRDSQLGKLLLWGLRLTLAVVEAHDVFEAVEVVSWLVFHAVRHLTSNLDQILVQHAELDTTVTAIAYLACDDEKARD